MVQRCRVSINQIGVVMVNKWLTLNNNHDWCQCRVLQTTTQITIAVADEGNNNKKNQSTYSIFTREKWFDIQLYWFQIKSFRFFSSCIEFDLTLGKRSESSSWTALKLLSNCSWIALELLLNCSWIALELLLNCSWIALELLLNCSGIALELLWKFCAKRGVSTEAETARDWSKRPGRWLTWVWFSQILSCIDGYS